MVGDINRGDSTLSSKTQNTGIRQRAGHIVELVGPAGSGKTTLARILNERDEKIRIGAEIEMRKMENIPIFLNNLPQLLPVFLRQCLRSRLFTWDEIKAMVYLKAWPGVLEEQVAQNDTTILLDHGPVFKLATLNAFGPEKLRCQEFNTWWKCIFNEWAQSLDLIILLDAPDAILRDRINSRIQQHAIKGESEREASQFLTRYRTSYEQILANLTIFTGPKLHRYDTSQASVEQIVEELLVTCKEPAN